VLHHTNIVTGKIRVQIHSKEEQTSCPLKGRTYFRRYRGKTGAKFFFPVTMLVWCSTNTLTLYIYYNVLNFQHLFNKWNWMECTIHIINTRRYICSYKSQYIIHFWPHREEHVSYYTQGKTGFRSHREKIPFREEQLYKANVVGVNFQTHNFINRSGDTLSLQVKLKSDTLIVCIFFYFLT
jgi:hypothetical protein